jgi:hypothetical protein
MEVKLDDIDLVKRVQPSATSPLSEVRAVYDVHVDGKRSIVELKRPGSSGNVLQDMGREPLTILLKGEVWGPSAKATITSIKAKSETGDSVPFSSDLLAAASVSQVIIEEFQMDQIAGNPTRYRYLMLLREFKEGGEASEGEAAEIQTQEVMGEEQEAPPDQTEEAVDDVMKQVMIDDIKGRVLDSEGNPAAHVTVVVVGPEGEMRLETNDEGYYEAKDAPEGEYDLTVDAPGFEDLKQKIEIVKSPK